MVQMHTHKVEHAAALVTVLMFSPPKEYTTLRSTSFSHTRVLLTRNTLENDWEVKPPKYRSTTVG